MVIESLERYLLLLYSIMQETGILTSMRQYLLVLLLTFELSAWRMPAVVTVPVADATGSSVRKFGNPNFCYRTIPCAPDKGKTACIRLHQLVCNQEVTMIREFFSGEVIIEIPGLFYYDRLNTKRNDFWTLFKYLMPLSKLRDLKQYIPPAVDRNKPRQGYKNVLTLKKPWHHKKVLYLAGTRFMRNRAQDTATSYGVHVIDYTTKKVHTGLVSKAHALVTYHKDFKKARSVFLSQLREWAHLPKGLVPYVWGGFSYREPCFEGFEKKKGWLCGHNVTYWDRKGFTSNPRSGFDCSNMILCAAQMAGLPYYCKNSNTLAKTLRPLKSGEKLEEGDLIWYSGHVMVVSDVEKNLIIEAIGYDSGYGCVHETHIKNVFEGIHNFNGLRPCHFRRKFTRRLRKDGSPWRSVYRLKILKLSSIVPAAL